MAYVESNGHVTDDVKVVTPNTLKSNIISKTAGDRLGYTAARAAVTSVIQYRAMTRHIE